MTIMKGAGKERRRVLRVDHGPVSRIVCVYVESTRGDREAVGDTGEQAGEGISQSAQPIHAAK